MESTLSRLQTTTTIRDGDVDVVAAFSFGLLVEAVVG